MISKRVPRGLYVITDSALTPGERLVEAVAQAVHGGAVMVQYRDKGDDFGRRLWEVQDLVTLCRPLGVPVIVNDDIALAEQGGADGVHLGHDDAEYAEARARLGERAIIGISCYNRLELAKEAAQTGADYVAFGSFFPSPTKPEAVPADVELLRQAKSALPVPVVAIGGISGENGAQLVEAGADLLAVISGVFGADDIRSAAARYAALF